MGFLLAAGCQGTGSDSAGFGQGSTSDSDAVMSFNIRYDNPGDSLDAWPYRAAWVAALLDSSGAAIIGLQEVLAHQLGDIVTHTQNYAAIGVGRDDGQRKGEFSPILYDSTVWNVEFWQTRWLSPDSSAIGVAGWDAALPRIATVADLIRVQDGQKVRVINTHFDHRGEEARLQSARLLARWAREVEGPVVVMGDFNFEDSTAGYQFMAGGADQAADGPLTDAATLFDNGKQPTLLGFDGATTTGPRIDYIFVNQLVSVLGFETVKWIRNGRFASDHLPVRANLRFNSANAEHE